MSLSVGEGSYLKVRPAGKCTFVPENRVKQVQDIRRYRFKLWNMFPLDESFNRLV